MNTVIKSTICCLSLRKKSETMKFSTRARRHNQRTDSLNNSLKYRKSRRSLSIKKNIINEVGPTQKYKMKSSHIENSNSSKCLTVISLPTKQCKEKERNRPHRCNLQTDKLNTFLRIKNGKNLLFKKNNFLQGESVQNSERKSYIQKNNANKTLEVSSPICDSIRQCHVLLQRINCSNRQQSDLLNNSLNFKKDTWSLPSKENIVHNVRSIVNYKTKFSNKKGNLEVSSFTNTPIKQCKVLIQRLDFSETHQTGTLFNSLNFKESTESFCKENIVRKVESCQNFGRKYSVKKNLGETASSSLFCTSKPCQIFVQRLNSSYRQQTDTLNQSLKTKRSIQMLCRKNILHAATSVQNSKRESCNVKDDMKEIFSSTSSPMKQYQEKEMTLLSTPHRQRVEKLKKYLKRKSGGKPLASKKNIVYEAGSPQKSKKKSVEKSTLNETLGVESVRRSLRKSIQNEKLKEPLEAESMNMSNKKSSMQRKNLNKTLKLIPLTSTPIKMCHVSVQKCINESLTTYNSRSKKQKNFDKTPISESSRYLPSCTLSVTLRPRRQTPCISETHTLESTKGLKKFPKKKKSVNKAVMNYKSFAGTATIDDLSIKAHKRKAKSEGYKVPAKNTLKRRRFVFNELNKANDDYEDDIYESQNFDYFKSIRLDSDSDLSILSIATPKLGVHVTPMIRKSTPVFKDCISPTEYAISRRVAEECQYRRRKNASSASEKTPVPEKKKLEFSRVLAGIQQKEKTFQRIVEGETSNLENSYFSDCSRLSTRPNQ